MNEATTAAPARTWKKIACFYILTILFSGIFGGFIMFAGKMNVGDLLFVTGAMWSPALAVFVTKKIFGESIRDLAWQWGENRYAWIGYFVPLLYALPVYVVVWLTGLGPFNWDTVQKIAGNYGWQNLPLGLTLILFVLLTATVGLIAKLGRALGEEIGWRGFLVPELAKVLPFPMVGLVSGLMWAAYHYPVLLFADYNNGVPKPYALICFTLMVIFGSIVMAWLVLRARSLWPAAILHASHNLFIQSIFTPLTGDTGQTKYIVDEFGIGLVITTAIGAAIVLLVAAAETKNSIARRSREMSKV
jgi:membrane protease YdiL (CAAX protease family)